MCAQKKAATPSVVYMPVYEPNTPTKNAAGFPTIADYLTPVEQAIAMVKRGDATFINHGKAIRLTSRRSLRLRGRSLNVNERLVLAYIDRSLTAVAIIEGWEDEHHQRQEGWAEQHRAVLRNGKGKRIRRRRWTHKDEARYATVPLPAEDIQGDGYVLGDRLEAVLIALRRELMCQ
jgi:hypothetical protein